MGESKNTYSEKSTAYHYTHYTFLLTTHGSQHHSCARGDTPCASPSSTDPAVAPEPLPPSPVYLSSSLQRHVRGHQVHCAGRLAVLRERQLELLAAAALDCGQNHGHAVVEFSSHEPNDLPRQARDKHQ